VTQYIETGPLAGPAGGSERPEPPRAAGPPPALRPWWRYPWMVPLALVAAGFLALKLPLYLSLDRSRSLVTLDPRYPMHYLFLVAHVTFGTIALLTVCLQVWPWLRRRHPAVHRWTGRVYVFAGVLPCALMALAIMPFSHGPVGNAVAAVLWLATTAVGFRKGRQRRRAEHRRWMIYSFALTLQIMWGRVMFIVLPLVPGFDITDPHTLDLTFESATWIGFVGNLLAAQWWLERRAPRRAV
jgi:hypothetical protein